MSSKRAIPNWVRREVCRRYGAEPGQTIEVRCHYCPEIGRIRWLETCRYWPMLTLELDHYVPEFAGGQAVPENIVLACRPCNRSKGHAVPTEPLVLEVVAP